MGSTADKLRAVLNSKNAIRDKFDLPKTMPFSQYHEAIKGDANITLGYINRIRNFQPLSFNGTAATDEGKSQIVRNYYTWQKSTPLWTTWDELSDLLQSGKINQNNLGDLIAVDYYAQTEVGVVSIPILFEIVAFDKANLIDSSKTHSMTLFAVKSLGQRAFATSTYWKKSGLRTFLQLTFGVNLDPDFIPHIAKIERPHWTSKSSFAISEDTVFVPSLTEIGLGDNSNVIEGMKWDIMNSDENRIRDIGSADYYWLSSRSTVSSSIRVIDRNGNGQSSVKYTLATPAVVPALVFV